MKEWKETEARATAATLKLWIQCCGDRKPSDYTTADVSQFHRLLKKLPGTYYHSSKYRKNYEQGGVHAVIAVSEGDVVSRMTDKTWNSHNSSLNAFFEPCAGKGDPIR